MKTRSDKDIPGGAKNKLEGMLVRAGVDLTAPIIDPEAVAEEERVGKEVRQN
ncbi:MAG TPA: hypothetical protein VKP88_04860 [Candidatus Paceibacterota bacterium]|nr:hypothetical protein [Candidatus Paceibacterota bacterium]